MSPLAFVLSLPVRAYRKVWSPWVGHGCRYQPTCSAYALEALEKEVKKKRKAEKAQKNAKLAGVKHLSFSNINLPYNLIINLPFDPEDPL